MKQTLWLEIKLESDTAFSRGDGTADEVDADVQHDLNGLPYLSGKTLKGLLSAGCAEVLAALRQSGIKSFGEWEKSAARLFGKPGSLAGESGCLHVGDARLPDDLRKAIAQQIQAKEISRQEVLESITTLRHQTAMNAETGAPLEHSLRTIRVILRKTTFNARLDLIPALDGQVTDADEHARDLALLAACAKTLRRAGAHRNRGLGKIKVSVFAGDPVLQAKPDTETLFAPLRAEVK